MKIKRIDFVSKDKINEKAHELVWRLFGIEGAIITQLRQHSLENLQCGYKSDY